MFPSVSIIYCSKAKMWKIHRSFHAPELGFKSLSATVQKAFDKGYIGKAEQILVRNPDTDFELRGDLEMFT
jgi:hypothetical protein